MADLDAVVMSSLESAGLVGSGEGGEMVETPAGTAGAGDGDGVEASAGTEGTEVGGAEAASDGTEPQRDESPDGDEPPPAESAQAKPPKGRKEGPIPFAKHKKILENARAEAAREIEALQQRLQALSWAESPDVQATMAAFQLADTNPRQFAELVLKDPQLGPVFRELMGGGADTAAAGSASQGGSAASSERPKPDKLFEDGTVGYSAEALEQLLEWERSQLLKSLESQFEQRLNERFKDVTPLIEQYRADAAFNLAKERMRPVLENARKTWPKFADYEAEIKAWLMAPGNERATLDDAYRAVVIPKLQSDRDAMRQEILAELNKRPAAAAPVARPAKPVESRQGPRDLDEVVMESLRAKGLLASSA